MNKLFLLVILALMAVPSAYATYTAQELSERCDSGDSMTNAKSWEELGTRAYDAGFCQGYLGGWLAEIQGEAFSIGMKGETYFLIFPEGGVTIGQLKRVFQKYVKSHPAEENKHANLVLIQAVLEEKIATVERISIGNFTTGAH